MAQAIFRSSISSAVLTSRASSIACWPSTTSMPSFSSARSIGSSIRSMPIGSLSMPKCTSAFLICLAKSPCTFICGGRPPCMVEIGAATLSAIHGEEMRLAGGAGSHRNGGPSHRAERIAHELVARPFADMGAGDVADVVEVEGDARRRGRRGGSPPARASGAPCAGDRSRCPCSQSLAIVPQDAVACGRLYFIGCSS